MGAAASVSVHEVLTSIESTAYEIELLKQNDPDTATIIALQACDNIDLIEEKLHELIAYHENETLSKTLRCVKNVGACVGLQSREYLDCLNVCSSVLLCAGNSGQVEEAERLISTGFEIHASNPVVDTSYARLVGNFYSLKEIKKDESGLLWARKELFSLVEQSGVSVKSLRYKLQNLKIVHTENGWANGAQLLQSQEENLLGQEDHPSALEVVFGDRGMPPNDQSTPMSRTSGLYFYSDDQAENTSPQSAGGSRRSSLFSDEYVYGVGTESEPCLSVAGSAHTVGSDLKDLQDVLFELVRKQFDDLDDVVEQALESITETEVIETLTVCNDQGDTLLLAACRCKNFAAVKALLEFGRRFMGGRFDLTPQLVGAKNAIGLTPVHVACHSRYFSYQVADLLLEFGGAGLCFSTDRSGCTPLHYAAAAGRADLVALLLVHGASPQRQDHKGFLPIDYCDPTNIEVFDLLYPQDIKQGDEGLPPSFDDIVPGGEWQLLNDEESEYFYNTITGEIVFPRGQNGSEQKEMTSNQAKAQLCLLQGGQEQVESLQRILDVREQDLAALRQQLDSFSENQRVTEEKLGEAIDALSKEREARQFAQNESAERSKQLVRTEAELEKLRAKLASEQELRDKITSELAGLRGEIMELQQAAKHGKGLTQEQERRLAYLNGLKSALENDLRQCNARIAALVAQLEAALKECELSQQASESLRAQLEEEERLRQEALLQAAALEEENARIQRSNERLATEKAAIEAKLATERKQLEEEATLRKAQEASLQEAEAACVSIQKALEKEQMERERAREALDLIQRQMRETEGDRSVLAQQEAEARERLKTAENELEKLRDRMQAAIEAEKRAAAELESLKEKLAKEERYRERAKQAMGDMNKRLRAANEELRLLMQHLENEKRQRERSAGELSSVQNEIERLRRLHSQAVGQNEAQAKEAAERVSELAAREERLAGSLRSSEADIARLSRELMVANYKSVEVNEECEALKARLDQERELRLNANQELGAAQAKLKAIEDEHKLASIKWNMERAENAREKAALQAEHEKLLNSLEEQRRLQEAKERRLKALENSLTKKDGRLEEAQEFARAKAEASRAANEELIRLREQLEYERKLRQAADAELGSLRQEQENQAETLRLKEQKQAELTRLEQERLAQVECFEKEKQELFSKLQEEQLLRQQVAEQLEKTNERLSAENNSRQEQLKKELEELRAKFNTEAEQKTAHQEELDRVKANLDRLQTKHDKTSEEAARAALLAQQEKDLYAKMKEMEEYMSRLEREKGALYDEFVEEQALRKQYFNEVEDLKGRIRVYCRVRPMNESERKRKCSSVIKVMDEMHVLLQHPEPTDGRRRKDDVEFVFDTCFDTETTQQQVFADSKRLIQLALDGYNVCIFAYGQTGSGKTYTLLGPDDDDEHHQGASEDDFEGKQEPRDPPDVGIAARSIRELFRLMERDKSRFKFEVSIYAIELYKETLVDLLCDTDNPPPLHVHLDDNGVVYVENIHKLGVESARSTLAALKRAFAKRKVTATKMNSHSSRSHLVFSLLIKATAKKSGVVSNGKLTIVDLAGSERASKTGATGDTLKEAQAINKSLLALGDVIQALTSNAKHVPYRNHPLTQLMADSIGGNAKTLMFVNINPADYNLTETKESLRWATRVKQVSNQSTKNTETVKVRVLKEQIEKLRKAAASAADHPGSTSPVAVSPGGTSTRRRKSSMVDLTTAIATKK